MFGVALSRSRGGYVSTTVTMLPQVAALPEASAERKVTLVAPRGKRPEASAPPDDRSLVIVGAAWHRSVALAVNVTGVPAPEAHSTVRASGQETAGGVVSTTRARRVSVAAFWEWSVTRSVIMWSPSASEILRRGPLPRSVCPGAPKFSNHSKLAISLLVPGDESVSLEADPFRTTDAPAGEVHSTWTSAPATATGG